MAWAEVFVEMYRQLPSIEAIKVLINGFLCAINELRVSLIFSCLFPIGDLRFVVWLSFIIVVYFDKGRVC